MNRLPRFVVAVSLLGLAAADWPQWRGPQRNGISPEKGLLKKWPNAGPQHLWTFPKAGTGYSSPAVLGGKVYILGARDNVEHVIALDGVKEKWATPIGPLFDFMGNAWSGGPNAAPVVDEDAVYALGSQGELVCVDRKGGKIQWQINLPKKLAGEVNPVGGGQPKMGWGYACAPLVDGDNLIVTPGGPQGLFAALNKKTGAVVWQSKGVVDQATYTAPVVANVGGVRQYITFVQNGAVGVSTKDGSLLWEHRRADPYPDIVCGTPLLQNNLVYLSVGGVGSELLKLIPNAGKFKVESVYAVRELANQVGGVVLVDGNVYGSHDLARWMCLDFMTGTMKWDSPRPRRGLGVGSVIYADGRLYCLEQDKGQAAMIEASPAGYKELSRFTLPQQSTLRKPRGMRWTHPVLSDGLLYLRDQELLFCYKVK